MSNFNQRVKQILLLLLILFLVYLIVKELAIFAPGLLGAVTLYILSRSSFFHLTIVSKWKKGWTTALYLLLYLLILGLPIYIVITLIEPKVEQFITQPEQILSVFKAAVSTIQKKTGINLVSQQSLTTMLNQLVGLLPSFLNSTVNLLANMAIMLFVLYYLLYNGREIEKTLSMHIPLKPQNINLLASETKRMIRANALGIPIISIIQGFVGAIGYFIFGAKDVAIWGLLTAVFAFFPIVGTLLAWVPLVVLMYANGDTWNATGVLVYSVLITGNVDYLARMTIIKRIGNVHPVVTILGIIVGVGLFGFMGLIFGPLLLSYAIILFRIYLNEFLYIEKV